MLSCLCGNALLPRPIVEALVEWLDEGLASCCGAQSKHGCSSACLPQGVVVIYRINGILRTGKNGNEEQEVTGQ